MGYKMTYANKTVLKFDETDSCSQTFKLSFTDGTSILVTANSWEEAYVEVTIDGDEMEWQ